MFSVVAHGGDFWRRNPISSHLLCLRFQCGGVELPRHVFSRALSSFTRSFHVMRSVLYVFAWCFHVFWMFLQRWASVFSSVFPCRKRLFRWGKGRHAELQVGLGLRARRRYVMRLETVNPEETPVTRHFGYTDDTNLSREIQWKKHLDIFVIKVLIPCSASLSWKSWKLVLFAPGHGIAFCCALKSTRTWLLLLKAQNSWTISFSDEATATCRDVRKSYCKLDKNLFFSREEKIQHDKDVAKCCCKHM